jgi:hypothetical protein
MERKTGTVRKTGSTRKTTLVKKVPKGTGPLILASTTVGVSSEIVGFFSLYWGFRSHHTLLLFLFSILSPIAGGAVWNRLCKRNKWPFFTGGPGNEPYGIYAFIWGFVTMLPIIFTVQILTSNFRLNSVISVLTWFFSQEFALILSYAFFSGIAAVVFFGIRKNKSLRSRLMNRTTEFETAELVIVGVWAVFLSTIPTFSISLFANPHTPRLSLSADALGYIAPVSISLVVCLLLLSSYFYFSDYKRHDPKGMFKGVLAEFGLRCSVFWGLWLLMDGRHLLMLLKMLNTLLNREFETIL